MGNAKKEDASKNKKTANSVRNEMQKAKSRDAAKTRRKNENDNIEQLNRLVPWIPDNPPDKSTIIRLSTSYIGLKKVLDRSRNARMIGNGCSATKGIENLSLEVMDGFIIFLARDGTIIFVNDKVVNYLGFPPHDLMGKKIYNFVLRKDWEFLSRKLGGDLPNLNNPNIREPQDDPDDVICEPEAEELFTPFVENATWNERVQFILRMQCNLVRRTTSAKNTSYQIVRFTGRLNADGYFLGTGEHAWSPDLGDLPVYEPAFISRLTADLKLLFCEGRIHRYMDSEAKDIVGRVVYPFYHPTDVFQIQKLHSKLLAEGKVTTTPYRWMNKDGGWVWLKSTTTRIKDEKTGKIYMLCVNYVLSAIENKGVVVGMNPETKERVIETTNKDKSEEDSDDAYLVNELTEAFTKSKPFGQPTYPTGALQDNHEDIPNVFSSNYYQTKSRYQPSFTAQECKAKPLQEFYTQDQHVSDTAMQEKETSDKRFERFSWPQGENTWQDERRMTQQNNFEGFYNSQHLEQFSLQDLIVNGQFSPDFLSLGDQFPIQEPVLEGNIFDPQQAEAQQRFMETQYHISGESFKEQSNGFIPNGHVKVEPDDQRLSEETCDIQMMTDLFDMPDLPYFRDNEELNHEDNAYEASLYLFDLKHVETPQHNKLSVYSNHQNNNNGFMPGMLINNQEQCYGGFSQVNHNNNMLPNDIVNRTQSGNSLLLAEDACILDFDQALLT